MDLIMKGKFLKIKNMEKEYFFICFKKKKNYFFFLQIQIFVLSDGTKYDGNFKNDNFEGHGVRSILFLVIINKYKGITFS